MRFKMENVDWAWLAGFLDADGCFTCAVSDKKKSISITPRIIASQMIDRKFVLDECVSMTGVGTVYTKKEKSAKSLTSKEQCMWHVGKYDDVLYICRGVRPFLKIKQKQCDILSTIAELRLGVRVGLKTTERIPIENTLEVVKLAMMLNKDSSSGRSFRRNGKDWEYWKNRIVEIYEYKDRSAIEKYNNKRVSIKCDNCGIVFSRLKCNIRRNTKHHFCSRQCSIEWSKKN